VTVLRPTPMKTLLAVLALVTLAACSGDNGGGTATDPAASPSGRPMPSEGSAAPGTVHTRGLVTVMDAGSPELCLGPVAESYPPQCGGPPIDGWDWADQQGVFERQGQVRWGQFAVTGRWDGSTFTVSDAIPAALYDAMPPEEPTVPDAGRSYTQAELEDIAERVGSELPGAQGAFADRGHVFVDVTYDDGSLQEWADEEYGTDVVIVVSALVDGP
jgi:hypothetical protein